MRAPFSKFMPLVATLMLTSCFTPPTDYKVNATTEINKPEKEVWDKVVEYFAVNDIKITTIDKNSGIIAGSKPADSKVADCGLSNGTPVLDKEQDEDVERPIMEFNIYLKPENNKTLVEVHNHAGKTKAFQPMKGDYDTICQSKGVLEADILDYLKK